jgi:hypothetical protein
VGKLILVREIGDDEVWNRNNERGIWNLFEEKLILVEEIGNNEGWN